MMSDAVMMTMMMMISIDVHYFYVCFLSMIWCYVYLFPWMICPFLCPNALIFEMTMMMMSDAMIYASLSCSIYCLKCCFFDLNAIFRNEMIYDCCYDVDDAMKMICGYFLLIFPLSLWNRLTHLSCRRYKFDCLWPHRLVARSTDPIYRHHLNRLRCLFESQFHRSQYLPVRIHQSKYSVRMMGYKLELDRNYCLLPLVHILILVFCAPNHPNVLLLLL